MKEEKQAVIRARLETELKHNLDEWCKHNDLSLSQVVRAMIRVHLEAPSLLLESLAEKNRRMDK